MEWLKRMSDAVDYMENTMEEPFDAAKIARVACSSAFHFQRMFHILTGMMLAEYVRKRKLTLAAQELAATKAKVIDVALKYGYETPESFTKAFRRLHGISPSVAREQGASLKAVPRISFQLSLKGDKEMDYKLVEKEAFTVVGKARRVKTANNENMQAIPKFWEEFNQSGACDKLCAKFPNKDILGICMEMNQEKEEFTYMIAVEGGAAYQGGEYVVKTIPASTWAVFTSIGPMPVAIQKVWERIFQEWFPATGYEHAGTPELEVYPVNGLETSSQDYRCEVWIPIIKK